MREGERFQWAGEAAPAGDGARYAPYAATAGDGMNSAPVLRPAADARAPAPPLGMGARVARCFLSFFTPCILPAEKP